jgi:ubiquinone/menaquinone biosynthesis C-methylase UbiE
MVIQQYLTLFLLLQGVETFIYRVPKLGITYPSKGRPLLNFEKEYFENRKYSSKECVIKRHFFDVLKWASKCSGENFFNGKGKTALAIGCGYGFEVDMLTSFGYSTIGIDISKYGIKQAKKRFSLTDFVICDVQKGIPFRENTFNLLTCFGVLEHLEHPEQALGNIFPVSKDAIICTSPNRRVEKILKNLTRDVDKTHINVKTKKEWEQAINAEMNKNFLKIESFFDISLKAAGKLLFFKSFKLPYFGLDFRIMIRKQ